MGEAILICFILGTNAVYCMLSMCVFVVCLQKQADTADTADTADRSKMSFIFLWCLNLFLFLAVGPEWNFFVYFSFVFSSNVIVLAITLFSIVSWIRLTFIVTYQWYFIRALTYEHYVLMK